MRNFYLLLFSFLAFSISEAQIVNIPDADFKFVLINSDCIDTDNDGVLDGDVDLNNDGEIQVSEAEAVLWLSIEGDLSMDSDTMEGIQSFVNLTRLQVDGTNITSIDLSNNTQLEELDLVYNFNLSSLDVSSNTNLIKLNCSYNSISSLEVGTNTNLIELDCGVNLSISSLDVTGLPNLEILYAQDNLNIEVLDLSQNANLRVLNFRSNRLTNLDLSANTDLISLDCGNNDLTTLDLSLNTSLDILSCNNNMLTELNIKNNSDLTEFSITGNESSLNFVCVDTFEQTFIQNILEETGFNTVVNSYCSFAPGGISYAISGESTYDVNNDGCVGDDTVFFSNMRFNITSPNSSGIFIANRFGTYAIPFEEGEHTLTPFFQNPDYFAASPTSVTVNFPSDTSPFTQNFCVTPTGVFNDLEISILPLTAARPGFDSAYKLLYKNKGNTVLTGTLSFEYLDEESLSFVSSIPVIDAQNDNVLSWDYANLLPFETREIEVVMNLNPPTDPDFPLVGGESLTYRARIFPLVDDQDENDNEFSLKQTVVNSFDPNDKRCLEGETITPDMVGSFVHYMVRFENTGSASAINVVIKDDIDISKFDITTLVPLDASHDFITRIGNTNEVEFIFENINLPFDDANNDGYVVFKIKTLSTLTIGDTFSNDAEIYFDFNFPIITNDFITTVDNNLSVNELVSNFNVKLYPNPVTDVLQIIAEVNIDSATIYDVNGRLLQTVVFVGYDTERTLDIDHLSKGVYLVKLSSVKGDIIQKVVKD